MPTTCARLGRIIASLDTPAAADLDVLPIRHAIASDVATMVNRLLESGQAAPGGADSGRTSLLADSRTNSVIIRAPSEARARPGRSLIDKLDQPTADAGQRARGLPEKRRRDEAGADAARGGGVRPVGVRPAGRQQRQQHAGQSGAQYRRGRQRLRPGRPGQGGSQVGLGQGSLGQSSQNQSSQGPLPTGGPGGFIQADPATNTLIITASEAVYRNLRAVIDQLDARRAQVYIESLIVEVTAKRAAEFGIQWAGMSGDSNSNYRVGTHHRFRSGGNNLITQAAAQLGAAASGSTTATTLQAPGNGLNAGIFRQIAGRLTPGRHCPRAGNRRQRQHPVDAQPDHAGQRGSHASSSARTCRSSPASTPRRHPAAPPASTRSRPSTARTSA